MELNQPQFMRLSSHIETIKKFQKLWLHNEYLTLHSILDIDNKYVIELIDLDNDIKYFVYDAFLVTANPTPKGGLYGKNNLDHFNENVRFEYLTLDAYTKNIPHFSQINSIDYSSYEEDVTYSKYGV